MWQVLAELDPFPEGQAALLLWKQSHLQPEELWPQLVFLRLARRLTEQVWQVRAELDSAHASNAQAGLLRQQLCCRLPPSGVQPLHAKGKSHGQRRGAEGLTQEAHVMDVCKRQGWCRLSIRAEKAKQGRDAAGGRRCYNKRHQHHQLLPATRYIVRDHLVQWQLFLATDFEYQQSLEVDGTSRCCSYQRTPAPSPMMASYKPIKTFIHGSLLKPTKTILQSNHLQTHLDIYLVAFQACEDIL